MGHCLATCRACLPHEKQHAEVERRSIFAEEEEDSDHDKEYDDDDDGSGGGGSGSGSGGGSGGGSSGGGDDNADDDVCDGVTRVKLVLNKEKVQWLMSQMKKGRTDFKELLEELKKYKGRRTKAWKPSLECIMECPEPHEP